MKRMSVIIIFALILITSASCDKESSVSKSDLGTWKPVNVSRSYDTDPQYVQAVKSAYERLVVDYEEYVSDGTEIYAYMTDLNGDGYKDIIYSLPLYSPHVLIYGNGTFKGCHIREVNPLDLLGKESGFFFDTQKNIIVIRYSGHTYGTIIWRGAEAFEITGTTATQIWEEVFDADSRFGDERYVAREEDDWDRVNNLINKEFNEGQYNERVKDYNLINYFDVYAPWDGSVMAG